MAFKETTLVEFTCDACARTKGPQPVARKWDESGESPGMGCDVTEHAVDDPSDIYVHHALCRDCTLKLLGVLYPFAAPETLVDTMAKRLRRFG